ncbi:MAG: pantetheine-phosphate adenylyltransferase [Actinomycetota bacterium]
MAVALYPGSFDPVHNGHLAVVEVAASLFERVIVAVGHNPAKPSGMLPAEERAELIRGCLPGLTNVEVTLFAGLVTTAAADLGADCLVKGIRSATDLDAEMLQANMNAKTGTAGAGDLPTVFLPGIGDHALISSRYVREIAARGGDVSRVVPTLVADRLVRLGTDEEGS